MNGIMFLFCSQLLFFLQRFAFLLGFHIPAAEIFWLYFLIHRKSFYICDAIIIKKELLDDHQTQQIHSNYQLLVSNQKQLPLNCAVFSLKIFFSYGMMFLFDWIPLNDSCVVIFAPPNKWEQVSICFMIKINYH